MNDFPPDRGDEFAQPPPHRDNALGRLHTDGFDDSCDVAELLRRLRPDNEIGSAEKIDMERVVFEHESVIQQFADLLRDRRGIHLKQIVECLGCRHVMRGGTNAADAAGDLRHFFGGSSHHEGLKSPEFRDLVVSPLHFSPVIEEYFDLTVTFEPRDRIDRDPACMLGGGCHDAILWCGFPSFCAAGGTPGVRTGKTFRSDPVRCRQPRRFLFHPSPSARRRWLQELLPLGP